MALTEIQWCKPLLIKKTNAEKNIILNNVISHGYAKIWKNVGMLAKLECKTSKK